MEENADTNIGSFKYATLLVIFGILVLLEYATYSIAGANGRRRVLRARRRSTPSRTTKQNFWAYVSMACSVMIFVGI
jgi:hypothetical protein